MKKGLSPNNFTLDFCFNEHHMRLFDVFNPKDLYDFGFGEHYSVNTLYDILGIKERNNIWFPIIYQTYAKFSEAERRHDSQMKQAQAEHAKYLENLAAAEASVEPPTWDYYRIKREEIIASRQHVEATMTAERPTKGNNEAPGKEDKDTSAAIWSVSPRKTR